MISLTIVISISNTHMHVHKWQMKINTGLNHDETNTFVSSKRTDIQVSGLYAILRIKILNIVSLISSR